MTSTDVLDVRAKAQRDKRRRRIASIVYIAIGITLFFVAWILLSLEASPWHYDIPPPFGAVGPFQDILQGVWGLFREEGAIAHFWSNLGTSQDMRIKFVHACPDLHPANVNNPFRQVASSLMGWKYTSDTAALTGGPLPVPIGQLPDYCYGYGIHLIVTIIRILLGAAFGTIAGLAIGLSSLVFPKVAQVFTPIASFFGTAPIFIAAPFFVIWFGVEVPIMTTIGLVTFYTTLLMYFFSRRAAENIPVGIVESALTLGGTPRSIFRWVYLPGTVPEIAGGFRIALAGAWGLGVLVEVLGIQVGGGHLIDIWRFLIGQLQAPSALVALITFYGVLAVVVDALLLVIIRYLTRWSEAGRRLGL